MRGVLIFTQVGTLSRHKKTDHGGVKYSWNHCEREYTQSGDLAKHVKTQHSTTADISYQTYQLSNPRCDNLLEVLSVQYIVLHISFLE